MIISGAVVCCVIFILVSTSLAMFPKCNQSHFIIQVSLSCYPWLWGNYVEFHSPSKHTGCMAFSFHFHFLAGCGKWGSVAMFNHSSCKNSILHLLLFFFATEHFPSIFLQFIRHETLLNFNVKTKHSSLTLHSHFSFYEKQSKRSIKCIHIWFASKYLQFWVSVFYNALNS